MDWDTVHGEKARRVEPSAPALVETRWRLRTPRGRIITCAIYRDAAPGFEVRAGFTTTIYCGRSRPRRLKRPRRF